MGDLPLHTRECDERIAKLEAENQRLKSALEEVSMGDGQAKSALINVAKQALENEE